MQKSIAIFLISLHFCVSNLAFGASASCDELGGVVVFKDTLYGAATGLLISGIALAASEHGDTRQYLTTGASIGAGFGVGLAAFELTTRECDLNRRDIRIRTGYLPRKLMGDPLAHSSLSDGFFTLNVSKRF